jgi:hypothetical protein
MSMEESEARSLITDTGLDALGAIVDVHPVGPPPPGYTAYWDVWIRGDDNEKRNREFQVTKSEEHPDRYLVGLDENDPIHNGIVGFTVEVGKTDIKPTIELLMRGVFIFA